VYYILVKGVTGARKRLVLSTKKNIDRLRTCTHLPIAAGFGISDGVQARKAARHADAVVVGSALVEAAGAGHLAKLVRELSAAVHGA